MKKLFAILTLALAGGCGATVGDACTTSSDCGPGTCLNRSWSPGGYCTTGCNIDNDLCPSGTTCVRGAIDGDLAGCMRSCEKNSDCRTGYICQTERESLTPVCVGSDGL